MATTPTFAPAQAAPLDAAILADPIEFIRFEHYRQRTLSDRLGRIARRFDIAVVGQPERERAMP